MDYLIYFYFIFFLLQVLTALCAVALARPEPPSYLPPSSFGPSSFGSSYGAPAPSIPSSSYGIPVQDSYGPPIQQSVVHKHVYVHVPPPEAPEYKAPKPILPPPPPQKHYKIVFIKAPTPPTPTAPVLPPLPPQDEEKTLIYVLVKKPEEQPEIVLPTQAPTQPSKPEVYFIRYKTQVSFFSIFILFILTFFFFLTIFLLFKYYSRYFIRRRNKADTHPPQEAITASQPLVQDHHLMVMFPTATVPPHLRQADLINYRRIDKSLATIHRYIDCLSSIEKNT